MEKQAGKDSIAVPRRHKHSYSGVVARVLGDCVQWSGLQRYLLRRPATHFVYLHHVHDLTWFEKLLTDLSRDFEFIDHNEGVRRIRSGENVRPAVTFSFDDGFASCEPAMKALDRSGTRGLIYICPELVGLDDDGISRFFGSSQPEGVLGWDCISAIKDSGHLIGSHTKTHRNLATLSTAELVDELEDSRNVILAKLGTCDHFAWPYGRMQFFSDQAYQIAVDAGYRSIASGIRGSHRTATQGMLFRHVIHPGQTAEAVKRFIALSLAGLDGHARSRKWVMRSNAKKID